MMSSTHNLKPMASGYALALFQLAQQSKCIEAVYHDLQLLDSAIQSIENAPQAFSSLLSTSSAEIDRFLDPFSQNLHPLVRNTLKVMAHSEHVSAIPVLFEMFCPHYEEYNGVGHVYIETAVDLSNELRATVTQRLQALFRLKEVRLQHQVNPARLGGLYVEYKGVRLDASLQRKLSGLESHLTQRLS